MCSFDYEPYTHSDRILIFRSAGSVTKVGLSAGSVLTSGTSINSNAGQFLDLIKLRETVL